MKLPDFSTAKVLVAGDLMLDRYWQGHATRISPESPVPVVAVKTCQEKPGGAGNVACNITSLGASAILVGIVGEDEAGNALRRELESRQVDCRIFASSAIPTITKLRVLSRNQQMLRLDFEESIPSDLGQYFNPLIDASIGAVDVVVISDYGKGTIADPMTLIAKANAKQIPVLVDPKGHDFERYRGAWLLTPNRKEFEAVMGHCENDEILVARAQAALGKYDLKALLVTRSEEGMTLVQSNRPPIHLPAQAREVFDVTGAGDTVIAMIAMSLSIGLGLEQAIFYANLAASIAVTKMGAASVTASELRAELNYMHGNTDGVVTEARLSELLYDARQLNQRIVMTNGCFDILHLGHIQYLKKAKAMGDRLIVAVNSDESVRRLKGQSRPINRLEERMLLLAELECVDWVLPFADDTPIRLIEMIKPNVLVKGGDYTIDTIVGSDYVHAYGGEVRVIDYVKGFSTSELIQHIIGEAS